MSNAIDLDHRPDTYFRPQKLERYLLSKVKGAVLGQKLQALVDEGFGKAFITAGAASAVTTLWRIDDRATSQFMQQFYSQLGSGKSKAEALREGGT